MIDDWENAMFKAREQLGYNEEKHHGGEDRALLVELSKKILGESRLEWYKKYKLYMKSDAWNKLKNKVKQKFNNKCYDCGEACECVHHISYYMLYTESEINYCVALCNLCHIKRHNLQKGINENNVFVGKCYLCSKINFIFRMDSWKNVRGEDGKDNPYYIRGSWRNFCKKCIKEQGWDENRKYNKCARCFKDFVGRKNQAKCNQCIKEYYDD